jgi:hypothetical protein
MSATDNPNPNPNPNPDPKLEIVNENSNDPFDLARLRVPQKFLEQAPVKKLITTIPIKKPGRQDFIRVRSEVSYRALMAILKLEDERDELYVVDLQAVPELQSECFIATLFTAITSTGVTFLWPVRVPASEGRANSWHVAAADGANRAMKEWIRVMPNNALRAYEFRKPDFKIPDPEWLDLPFAEMLRIALKDHHPINSLDHPVAKRLRGA